MNLITLSNALKSVFGTQITPNASQFVPVTDSDGTPAGISSMPDFASFLGGELRLKLRVNGSVIVPNGTITLTAQTAFFVFVDSTLLTTHIVLKAGAWHEVVSELSSVSANKYTFSIVGGNLVATNVGNSNGTLFVLEFSNA